jgi:hypothetical protein
MGIKAIAKPAGKWCPHCSPGVGCALYPAHPSSCQEFACLWLTSTRVPDNCRPDRTKVVLLRDPGSGRLIAHCDPNVPAPWRSEPIYSFLKNAARAGWVTGGHVIALSGSTQWLITPTDDLDLGRIDPGTPYRIRETADSELVLSILRPVDAAEQTKVVERVLRRQDLTETDACRQTDSPRRRALR